MSLRCDVIGCPFTRPPTRWLCNVHWNALDVPMRRTLAAYYIAWGKATPAERDYRRKRFDTAYKVALGLATERKPPETLKVGVQNG